MDVKDYLLKHYPGDFNSDIAAVLGCSVRTVLRSARKLGLEKAPGFLVKNKAEMTKRMLKSKGL